MSRSGAIILMYHGIEDPALHSATPGMDELVYVVGSDDFERQLDHISSLDIEPVLPGFSAAEPDARSIILTFDDGHLSDYSIAFPSLSARGMKGVFFVTTDWIGRNGFMTEDMISELNAAGMVIGSHGRSHRFLTDLSPADLADEIVRSRKRLEDITGDAIDSFSAPGGRIDRRVIDAARTAGYRWIYSSRPVINRSLSPDRVLGRYAVTRSRSMEWYRKVTSGNPPMGEAARYRFLKTIKTILGNDAYIRLRKRFLGG